MAEPGVVAAPLFLQPGELAIVEAPQRVKTVLGSCVAVIMRSARLGLAAMAHCLLPSAGVEAGGLLGAEALRYVDTSIDLMLREFARRGATAQELEIKLFGGANSGGDAEPDCGYCVGKRNVEAALEALAARGLTLKSSDLGGKVGRVIELDPESGDVFVTRLRGLSSARLGEGQ
jgi:chemotaxis protein CheD